MEEEVRFVSGPEELEGILEMNSPARGVVITHPHSLYGGNMHNAVVEAIARAWRSRDASILKFNFRGVGESTGRYEDGRGEEEDVNAAIAYLRSRGVAEDVDLAGYSFGAFVNYGAVQRGAAAASLVMVSPPVAVMDFGAPRPLPLLRCVVTGSRDEIASPVMLRKIMSFWNPAARLEVIAGADHYFDGFLKALSSLLRAVLDY